jgi:hypothetical protein
MTSNRNLLAVQAAISTLIESRLYVDNAYECAFPNESKNNAVVQAIDDSLASLTELERTIRRASPAMEVTGYANVSHGMPDDLKNQLLYVDRDATIAILSVKHEAGTWTPFPPSHDYLTACLGRAPQRLDTVTLQCGPLTETPQGLPGASEQPVTFTIAHIGDNNEVVLEAPNLLIQTDASLPVAQMREDGIRFGYLSPRTSVPRGTKLYLAPV